MSKQTFFAKSTFSNPSRNQYQADIIKESTIYYDSVTIKVPQHMIFHTKQVFANEIDVTVMVV